MEKRCIILDLICSIKFSSVIGGAGLVARGIGISIVKYYWKVVGLLSWIAILIVQVMLCHTCDGKDAYLSFFLKEKGPTVVDLSIFEALGFRDAPFLSYCGCSCKWEIFIFGIFEKGMNLSGLSLRKVAFDDDVWIPIGSTREEFF